jgi:invasion protein IalB
MLMNPCRIAALASLAVVLGVSGALAQPPAGGGPTPSPSPSLQAAPPAAATPASYGEWVLRCELLADGAERACEAAQTVFDQRGLVLAQIAARQAGPAGAIMLAVQVGTNATVSEPLRFGVENEGGLALAFRRCLPRGCFAEGQPPAAELAALLPRTEPARIEFRDGENRPVTIPVSLRGLATSLDALRAAQRG